MSQFIQASIPGHEIGTKGKGRLGKIICLGQPSRPLSLVPISTGELTWDARGSKLAHEVGLVGG